MEPLLSIINVFKQYNSKTGAVHALNGVSCNLYEHSVTCLIGVNGAGKTTLSSIIASLHPATSGDIHLRGASVYSNITNYRRHIGYVPQQIFVQSDASVFTMLVENALLYGLTPEQATANVERVLTQLGLQKVRDRLPQQLSGGYKQRVAIARALTHEPDLIILDEPTVGLDPHARSQVLETIQILRQDGASILLTTHHLDEVEMLADQAVFIDRGKVLASGDIQSIKHQMSAGSLHDAFLKIAALQ